MQTTDERIITDEQLGLDVKAALLKRETHVDLEEQWKLFADQHDIKPQVEQPTTAPASMSATGNRARLVWMSAGVLIGVAASLLCVFLLRPAAPVVNDESLLVSRATDQTVAAVQMTSTPLPSETAVAEAGARPVSDDVLDLRRDTKSPATMRTVTTPRGKVQKIVLADGTTVLLNNESRLRFPSRFTGERRTVYLEGEAYFTVAHDSRHPFIVRSGSLSTTALGTEFNVSAYARRDLCITLVEGSVEVADSAAGKRIILQPGQDVRAVNNNLVIRNADTRTYTEWKEGFFYYDNESLVDILVELGRWYNVNIELQNRSLMSYRLRFFADRNASVDDIVERLNQFSYLSVSRNGNNLYVKGKKDAD